MFKKMKEIIEHEDFKIWEILKNEDFLSFGWEQKLLKSRNGHIPLDKKDQ